LGKGDVIVRRFHSDYCPDYMKVKGASVGELNAVVTYWVAAQPPFDRVFCYGTPAVPRPSPAVKPTLWPYSMRIEAYSELCGGPPGVPNGARLRPTPPKKPVATPRPIPSKPNPPNPPTQGKPMKQYWFKVICPSEIDPCRTFGVWAADQAAAQKE